MFKKIFILLMVLVPITLISAQVFAKDLVLTEGEQKLTITYQKDASDKVVDVIVKFEGDKGKFKEGTIDQLSIKIKGEDKKDYQIKEIRPETVIKSESSPGCTWYFFMNRWWCICR